jgi:hypothetical protein
LLREDEISIDDEDVINNTSSIMDPNGISISDTGRSVTYPLNERFYLYIRSVSNVKSTFSFKSSNLGNNNSIRVLPNELVS